MQAAEGSNGQAKNGPRSRAMRATCSRWEVVAPNAIDARQERAAMPARAYAQCHARAEGSRRSRSRLARGRRLRPLARQALCLLVPHNHQATPAAAKAI